jgi:hypothetical protein
MELACPFWKLTWQLSPACPQRRTLVIVGAVVPPNPYVPPAVVDKEPPGEDPPSPGRGIRYVLGLIFAALTGLFSLGCLLCVPAFFATDRHPEAWIVMGIMLVVPALVLGLVATLLLSSLRRGGTHPWPLMLRYHWAPAVLPVAVIVLLITALVVAASTSGP